MTDHHIYEGAFPARTPLILGHESAGEVVETGEGVTAYGAGDRVAINPGIPCGHCRYCKRGRLNLCENYVSTGGAADEIRDGSFAEYVRVPQSRVEDVGDLPFRRAAFAEPLACVLHGVDRSDPAGGSRVVVVGAGPIGLLLVQAYRATGAGEVIVSEPIDERRRMAVDLGASAVFDPTERDPAEYLETEHGPVDIAVEAVGRPSTIETAVEVTSPGGRTLVFGVPSRDAAVELSPFDLYYDELSVVGSYAKTPETFARAVTHLRAGHVEVDPLVTDEFGLDGLSEAFEQMSASEGLKKVVYPGGRTDE